MALTYPTKDQLYSTILAIWKGFRPDADSTKYSDLWLFSRVLGTLVFRLHQTFERALNGIFPTSSYDEYLDNWLSWVGASNGSGGYGLIIERGTNNVTEGVTVTATGATADIQNEELTDSAGNIYKINESKTFAAAGSDNLDFISVSTGSSCNIESGTTLTFSSPPANIQATATTVVDADGAADDETNAAGRARLLNRLRNPPASGNVADWVDVIESVSQGNLKAYVWPKRENQPCGYGRTDYCAFQINETGLDRKIIATDSLYTDIDTAVDDDLPVLLVRNSRQLVGSEDTANIRLTYTLSDGAQDSDKCDWDSEGNKTTVSAHDAGGPEVDASANVCSPTITNGIEVGHRVNIGGIEGIVTAVNIGADASKFEVDDWPWDTGAAALNGQYICSGGGLVGEAKTATTDASGVFGTMQAYVDTRGPATGAYAAQTQIPDWDSIVRLQGVQSDIIEFGDNKIIDVTIADIGGGGAADFTPTVTTDGFAHYPVMLLSASAVYQVFV